MTSTQATAEVFWTAFLAMAKEERQAFLERLGSVEPLLGAIEVLAKIVPLPRDPVTDVGVDQRLQVLAVELVVVHQDREAIV